MPFSCTVWCMNIWCVIWTVSRSRPLHILYMYSYVCIARAEERVRRGDHRSAHACEASEAAVVPSTLSTTNWQAPVTSRQSSGALLYSPLFSSPLLSVPLHLHLNSTSSTAASPGTSSSSSTSLLSAIFVMIWV